MRANPQMGRALRPFEQTITWRQIEQSVVDYHPINTVVAEKGIRAVVQPAKAQDIIARELDSSGTYIRVHSKSAVNINDRLHYKGRLYKVASVSDWQDYGYTESFAELIKGADTPPRFITTMAQYVSGLLGYPADKVVMMHAGYIRRDMHKAEIAVMQSSATVRGRRISYNEAELKEYHTLDIEGSYRLDFWGDGAQERAEQFAALQPSQRGIDLQFALSLTVYHMLPPLNIGYIEGTLQANRWQAELNVRYETSVAVDTDYFEQLRLGGLLFDL
jgi:hypothetical protein